jgi:hypothetical protein
MKFNEILKNYLVEDVQNKRLFALLMNKWKEQKPNIDETEGEFLYNEFRKIQNGLSPNRPQVISFLTRFDGSFGLEKFEPENLKDITKYTYKQIRFLIDEYRDDELNIDQRDVFAGKDTKPTEEKIEASKNLWFGSDYNIINSDGFRVYAIPDQKTSVKFGYYVEVIHKSFGRNQPWCVTWRPDQQNRTNMWGNYRNERTFYFVIDESKGPEDKYYLGALQRDNSTTSGYRITSVLNDGDTIMNWDEVLRIYPKLAQYKDLISVKPFTQEELEEKNIVGRVTETTGSEFEFKRMPREIKRAYINNNGVLKKSDSWKSMDEKLRNLYVLTTIRDNLKDKFSNFEFVNEVKKIGSEWTLLDNKLKQLGYSDGVAYLMTSLLKNEFRLRRTSLDNPQIKIMESKVNGLVGVYHAKIGDWLKHEGIKYEPLFREIDSDVYFANEDDTSYFVETYKKESEDIKFYAVYPTETQTGECHIISSKKWEELSKILDTEKRKISPDTDVDIKEIRRV